MIITNLSLLVLALFVLSYIIKCDDSETPSKPDDEELRPELHKFIEKLEAGLKACQHVKKTLEDHYDIKKHPLLFDGLIMPVTSKDVFAAKHFTKILNSNSKFVYAFQGTSVLNKFLGLG